MNAQERTAFGEKIDKLAEEYYGLVEGFPDTKTKVGVWHVPDHVTKQDLELAFERKCERV